MRKLILAAIALLPAVGFAFPVNPIGYKPNASRQPSRGPVDNKPVCVGDDTMTGDWLGIGTKRCELKAKGIDINATYVTDTLFNVSGGLSKGGTYTDSWGLDATFDLDKLAQIHNTEFGFNLVDRNGRSLSQEHIGNQFSVQQIFGNETFIVDTVFLRYHTDDDVFTLTAGRLNTGDDFMADHIFSYFVSNAFNGNPIAVFFNLPFSAYPNAQWGARATYEPIPGIVGQFGIYNTNQDSFQGDFNGLAWSFSNDSGVLLITEWDYISQHASSYYMPAKYGVGFMYLTGDNQTKFSTGENVRGNYGVYYQLSQQLTQPNGPNTDQGLSAFFTMQYFPPDRNQFSMFFNGGVTYKGLIPGRPDDVAAAGWVYGKYSKDLASSQQSDGIPSQNFESVAELNYRIQMEPWFYVEPDVQYIIRPSGTSNIPDAWVVGAQIGLTF